MNALIRTTVFKALALACNDDCGKIVFYHDVHKNAPRTDMSTPWHLFCAQRDAALRNGFHFVNHVPDVSERKTVQVCLDDGFSGVWDVRNELVEMDVLPTVYVAVDLIGRPGYLDRAQILELQAMGFTFECHTWTHRGLTEIDAREWRHEIVDSRNWLSDFLQRNVSQLCFPKGLFSRGVYDLALESGYDQLMSSIPGSVNQSFAPRILPRNLVQFYSPEEYACVLKGALGIVRSRYGRMHVEGAF